MFSVDIAFREKQVEKLPNKSGVYILCDLDEIPVYVGKSEQIRNRVQKHLTAARSDLHASNQINILEIGYVKYIFFDKNNLSDCESRVFHFLNLSCDLINSETPFYPKGDGLSSIEYDGVVKLVRDSHIDFMSDPMVRLLSHIDHISVALKYYMTTKRNENIKRQLVLHGRKFLKRYEDAFPDLFMHNQKGKNDDG